MLEQLTQIVQLQWITTAGKLWKMARDYQKDKSVITVELIYCKNSC